MTIPVEFGEAAFFHTGGSAPSGAVCTIGFRNLAEDTPTEIASAIFDFWGASISAVQTNQVEVVEVRVKLGPDEDGPFGSDTGGFTGEITSGSCSPQVALLIHKSTLFGGRKGRGRMFIPGVPEPQVDPAGNLDSGYLSDVNDAVTGFAAAMVLASLPPFLLHEDETVPYPIVGLSCDPRVATQRRRLRR